MEIDFLGLNSSKYSVEQEGPKNVFSDTGGVEISLSLSTSSSHKEILNFSENKKKTWEFAACEKMIPSCSGSRLGPYNPENSVKKEQLLLVASPVYHRPSAAGFPYDLNDAASNLRSNSQLPTHSPTSTMLYPRRPTVFNEPEKADKTMYIAGNASTGLSRSTGYTPTVAMARRATLARFLEKRSHRMNQGRTSPLMGKPLSINISDKRNSLKRR